LLISQTHSYWIRPII